MLTVFRNRHSKKILWLLAGVVIVAFGLSGAGFFLRGRAKGAAIMMNNRRVSASAFDRYTKMARLHLILTSKETEKISRREIESLGAELLLLLWKAKKDRIQVNDKEVVDYIAKTFFPGRKFNQGVYERFLRQISNMYGLTLTLRGFEEDIRNFISINKLFDKYVQVNISDEEAKDLYNMENQKAKIDYLFIPYEKFKMYIGLNPKDIEDFYQKNQSLFQKEAKVKFKYLNVEKGSDLADKIPKALSQVKNIAELEEKFSLTAKETPLLGENDPIEDIGWQPQINKIAFGLALNSLSPAMETEKSLVVIEKTEEQPSFVPPLKEVEAQVREKLTQARAKDEAKRFAVELVKEIKDKKNVNLKKVAAEKDVELKETDYFKRYDYIEGIGLEQKVFEAAFSLEEGQIHPEPIILKTGAYIIQLKDMTDFDEKDFQEKKQEYIERLKKNKDFSERVKFLNQLKKEANLRILPQS